MKNNSNIDNSIVHLAMEFVNTTFEQAKNANFKTVCWFIILLIMKIIAVIGTVGALFWMLRNF